MFLLDDGTGQEVARALLGPGQQGQKTPTGGAYQFDPPAGRYRIDVRPDLSALVFPSSKKPPLGASAQALDGIVATDGPGGLVSPNAKPTAGDAYYLRFVTRGARGEYGNNHVPLDPTTGLVHLAVTALTPHVTTGDSAAAQITIDNGTTTTFGSTGPPPLVLSLALPDAFAMMASSLEVRDRVSGKVVTTVAYKSGALAAFALPAGAKYEVRVPLSATARQKTGRFRVAATLAGGAFSAQASALVTVDEDAIFDRSEVLGRVFCDNNQNRRFDDGVDAQGHSASDRGLPFVQVFLDNGAYAVTDAYGKFHFSNVTAGVHLAKVDVNSLPPGSVTTTGIRQDFHLTSGLPAKIDFGFQCALEKARVPNGEIVAVLPPVQVSGHTAPLALTVAGVAVPTGVLTVGADVRELTLRADGTVPAFSFLLHAEGDIPKSFSLIVRNPKGDIILRNDWRDVMPEKVAADFSRLGQSLLAAGETYVYELVAYDDARLIRSAPHKLHVFDAQARGGAPVGHVLATYRGTLFRGDVVAPELVAKLRALARPAGAALVVEVHTADDDSKAMRLMTSQRHAEAVRRALIATGVAPALVKAVGRGDLEPLVPNLGKKGREENRRIVIRVEGAAPIEAASAPASDPAVSPAVSQMARVQGEEAALKNGEFAAQLAPQSPYTLLVQDADGHVLAVKRDSASERREGALVVGSLSGDAVVIDGVPVLLPLSAFACTMTEGSADGSALRFHVAGVARKIEALVLGADDSVLETVALVPRDGTAEAHVKNPLIGTGYQVRCRAEDGDSVVLTPKQALSPPQALAAPASIAPTSIAPTSIALTPSATHEETVRGALFAGNKLGPDLRRALDALPRDVAVSIEVHSAGDGAAAFSKADSAREAELARKYLQSRSVQMVSATGLGKEHPLLPPLDKKALARNRRVVIRYAAVSEPPLVSPSPTVALAAPTRAARLEVNGTPTSVTSSGQFRALIGAESDTFDVHFVTGQGREAQLRVRRTAALLGAWRAPFAGEAGPETAFMTGPSFAAAVPLTPPAAKYISAVTLELPLEAVTFKADKFLARVHGPKGTEVVVLDVTGGAASQPAESGLRAVTGEEGEAELVVPLHEGANTLSFAVRMKNGEHGTLVRHYVMTPNRWFLMALGEGSVGQSGAQPMLGETTTESTVQILNGEGFLHGRGVLYFKGRFKGDWFFKDNRITAYLDSAAPSDAVFARNVIDPDRFYPVYGDSGSEVQDVNTQYKMYVMIEADDSKLQGGSIQTKFKGLELLRYDRSLFGARLEFNRGFTKYDKTNLTAFVGNPVEATRRVHVSLRGTGGALYFLRDRDIVEGSEVVRFVVRDAVSGTVVQEVPKSRNVDYTVSYDVGRMVFMEPIPAYVQGSFGGLGLTPISVTQGNALYVEVDYEARDGGTAHQVAGGAYLKETLFDRVTLGGGFVDEHKGDGSGDYRVFGGSIEAKPVRGVQVSGELNHSESQDTTPSVSVDGGLSYADTTRPATSSETGTVKPVTGYAMKATVSADLKQLLGTERELVTLSGYAARIDPNYYSSSATEEQGQVKFGVAAKGAVTDKDFILARHDGVFADIGDQAQPSYSDRRVEREISSVGYEHKESRWSVGALYYHQFTSDSGVAASGTSASVIAKPYLSDTIDLRGDYQLTHKLGLFATQEFVLRQEDPTIISRTADHFATQLGVRYKLTDSLEAQVSEILRYGGSNATDVSLRVPTGEGGRMYVSERFSRDLGGWNATTIVGGENAVARGSRAYGEYQLNGGASGESSRAVYGLNNRWEVSTGLYVNVLYERSQNLGSPLVLATGPGALAGGLAGGSLSSGGVPTLTSSYAGQGSGMLTRDRAFAAPSAILGLTDPVGIASRDAVSVGGELMRWAQYFKLTGRFEMRYDRQDPMLNQHDRILLFGTLGGAAQLHRDLSLLGNLQYANAREPGRNTTLALLTQGSIGLAYRPTTHDYFHALFKYTKREFMRPRDVAPLESENSDTLTFVPIIELPWIRLQVAEKLALKVQSLVVDGLAQQRTSIWLSINRLNAHILKWLDAAVEYRLRADTAAHQGAGGFVGEVSVLPWEYVRIGVGYNFTHFSDDEFADPRIDNKGFFIRAVGRY